MGREQASVACNRGEFAHLSKLGSYSVHGNSERIR